MPDTPEQMLASPLTAWIEQTLHRQEPDGNLRRRTPISLQDGAQRLMQAMPGRANLPGALRQMFCGAQLRLPDGSPLFAFKLTILSRRGERCMHARSTGPTIPDAGRAVLCAAIRVSGCCTHCRFAACVVRLYAVLKDDQGHLCRRKQTVRRWQKHSDTRLSHAAAENAPTEWGWNTCRRVADAKASSNATTSPMFTVGLGSAGRTWVEEERWRAQSLVPAQALYAMPNCGEFYTGATRTTFASWPAIERRAQHDDDRAVVSALRNAAEGGIAEKARKL